MEYTDDILRRVRAALMSYRAATRVNGRKRTWSFIAEQLDVSDAAVIGDDDDRRETDPNKPLAEALRRFEAGTQTPTSERLDSLCRFLRKQSFLTDNDLTAAEPASPLISAVREFFGAAADTPLRAETAFNGSFVASRKRQNGRTELSIMTLTDSGAGTVAADNVYSLGIPPQSTRRDALMRLLKRTGGSETRYDGWLIRSPSGQVCAFLRDSLLDESSIYLVLDQKVAAGPNGARMMLVKSRDFGAARPGGQREKLSYVTKDGDAADQKYSGIIDNIWEYRQEAGGDGA